MTKHPRMIAAIALITLAAVALTGCLVTKKAPEPPYYRKSDNLRVYKQGDWIRYNVFAVLPSGDFANGVLEVQWGNYSPLTSPDSNLSNDGAPYDVIEKRYLFCLDGTGCTPTETVIQYIHQDDPKTDANITLATAGTERLVAMGNHPTAGQYYWLNTTGGRSFAPANPANNLQGGQEPARILASPLVIGNTFQVEYFLMSECYPGPNCTEDIGTPATTFNIVGDSTQIDTNVNSYADPIQVNFNGTLTSYIGSLPLTFDIFDLCSSGYSEYNGDMYIVPEIGIVQMENTCMDETGNITAYDITLADISPSILAGS